MAGPYGSIQYSSQCRHGEAVVHGTAVTHGLADTSCNRYESKSNAGPHT